MQEVRALFSATGDELQTKINEGINHLAEIGIILTVITITLVIHI